MADALSIQIAEAIKEEINGHSWLTAPEVFTAQRVYRAVFKGDELNTLKMTVVALSQADIRATRKTLQGDFGFAVVTEKRLANADDVTEMDGWVNFLGEIKDHFDDNHKLASPLADWRYQSAAYFPGDEIYDRAILYDQRELYSELRLIVRGQR